MSRGRILVLTASHLCRNPRVVKEATALGAAGYDVTVLNVASAERFEKADRELAADLPFRREVLDLCGPGSRWRSLSARGLTRLARAMLRRFGIETAAALGPSGPLFARSRALAADLTIAHNEVALWIAQRLAREGRRVAVDFEDWYSEDLLSADRSYRPQRLLKRTEGFALQHAAFTTATSASMADLLMREYGGTRPLVVRNVFPLQPRSRLDRAAMFASPSFVWFSQTIGPGRGLEQFFAAWNQTKRESRVCLIGDERPGYVATLLGAIAPERRARVSVLPFVAPAALPDKLTEFDVGLALEPSEPRNRDVTITNKIFQYLNAGLAIVATETAGQREVFQSAAGCGVLVRRGDTAQYAAQLDALLEEPAKLRACQSAARAAAEAEFCWEKNAPVLLEAVARALHEN